MPSVKFAWIALRRRGQLHYITQIGTGNYNEKTSTMYTDLSLLTADEKIGLGPQPHLSVIC